MYIIWTGRLVAEKNGDRRAPALRVRCNVRTNGEEARKLLEHGYAFTTRFSDFYNYMVKVNIAVSTYRPETFKNIPQIYSAYENYPVDLERFNAFRNDVNAAGKSSFNIRIGLAYTATS